MRRNTILKVVDDISIVVPDSLNLITTYVLREQEDWFEDEIKFVRLLLKPQHNAIDIGANYGLFATSMARVVGPQGRIWAFEPASSTAALLAESIDTNGFTQITLDQRAISEKAGTAQLSLNDNSELNELVRDGSAAGATETVTLTTLDDAMVQYEWDDIAFVKIDAEGEEAAILRGGQCFFQTLSPLVQYEVKAGNNVHLELVKHFQDIGYSSYRLIPGLNVLLPFDFAEEVDPYLLNLFCCKPDRAGFIAAAGRLVQTDNAGEESIAMRSNRLLDRWNADSSHSWENVLARLPYGKQLASSWRQTVERKQSSDIEKALALHAISHNIRLPLPDRVHALRTSLELLTSACVSQPGFLRSASLARVAREYGTRMSAVKALNELVNQAMMHRRLDVAEPFLPAHEYYDSVDPGESIGNWAICSALEGLERNGSFSSFYTGGSARQRLEIIRDLGFGSPEMARRLKLVEQRFYGGALSE